MLAIGGRAPGNRALHRLRQYTKPCRVLLLSLVLSACATSAAAPSAATDTATNAATATASPLRVVTWNIAAGHGNLDAIAAVLREVDADIIALQEVDVHWSARSGFVDQARSLAQSLGMHARFAPIYSLPATDPAGRPREYGVALLTRSPTESFMNHALTRLSTQQADGTPAPMPGFLEVEVGSGSQRIRVFNTHLDYRADPAVRITQVREMLAIIGDAASPTLLLGDLNAPPHAPELAPLFRRLQDTWSSAYGMGYTYPASAPVRRIDYVLASRHFRVQRARTDSSVASDHRPVIVDFLR